MKAPQLDTSTEQLIEHLRTPEAYPHGPESVDEIQTHASWVFLVPPFVYKIKKPVALGFLDFSTLDKRRHFCEQELELNRRLCADVYLDVVPISQVDGGFVLESDANVVEYAVKMRYLSGGDFAIDLAKSGALRREQIDRLVDLLVRFYRSEQSTPEIAGWGRVDKLRVSTDENFEQTEIYEGELVAGPALDAIRFYTDRFYECHARLLASRRAGGWILDCHGDLHLEHVYFRPNDLCIYDCIEFSERLRYIDVANDVAFLAMDLDLNGCRALSRYFTAEIAQRLGDPELPVLSNFYKCYRAVVRAKVDSMRYADADVPAEQREDSRDLAVRYYRLALGYALFGSSPGVIVVMGRVGTGKSTVASRLGEMLGWEVFSSDRVRKTAAGIDLYERRSEDERRDLYSSNRTEETYAALLAAALDGTDRGTGVVIDATYSKRAHRDDLRGALRDRRIPYGIIELTASDDVVRERLKARETSTGSISDARLDDFEMLAARYEAPDDLEDTFHIPIPSDQPLDRTISSALRALVRLDLGRAGIVPPAER